jgi:glycosyltransferase involved in cell wall biosynthesis
MMEPKGQKIRVLQLIDGFDLAGAETVVAILSKNLDPSCFEVIPCALYRFGPLFEELQLSGAYPRVLGLRRRSILSGPLFLADIRKIVSVVATLLEDLSVDIVHAHLTESILLGILAADRVKGPKVCATIHSLTFNEQRAWWDPRKWCSESILPRILPRADSIVAVSHEVAAATARQLRIPLERVLTIPNGINGSRFRHNRDVKVLRHKLALPTDEIILLSVGRLTRQKGYPVLLSALKRIPEEKRPLTIIIGDGPDKRDLHLLASQHRLTDTVRFLGRRSDIADYLEASDLFVMSSLWEGLPLALLEAMAAALPVIVTRVGGNAEVVEEDRSGILVPPGNDEALAQAVLTLVDDPAKRAEFGMAACERIKSNFSLEAFVKAYETLYMTLHTPHSEPRQRLLRQLL